MPAAHRRGLGLAHPLLRRLPDHPPSSSCCGRTLGGGTPEFLAMKKHPTASEGVCPPHSPIGRIVILGMMIAVLTTTTFYFVTVYTADLRQDPC